MDYQISDKAKKVTLGVAILGFVLLVLGFFTQKEYVFPTVIDEHTVIVEYWGGASNDKISALKEDMISRMEEKGFGLEIHEEHTHHVTESEEHHIETEELENNTDHDAREIEHEHHESPTFLWTVHVKHSEDAHHGGHENAASGAEQLAAMMDSGDLAFNDSHFRRFWSNLLVNGFFFFGIALGALFYLALHYATESGWGVVLLRVFEGVSSALPIGMVVLLIVFLASTFGMTHIYPWMDADVVAHDDLIWGKSAYLNKPFFWIRIIAYFGVFMFFLNWFKKTSRKEDVEGGTTLHYLMYRRAALFLVFFAVFSSTMSWDIIMSIDTHWYSTLFGWYVFSGIWISGMIMVMMTTLYLKSKGYLEFVNSSHIHDIGKWMFALSFLWSYLWFSQFMLIWYSNIPEEVTYFITRIAHYKFVFFAMFTINFVLPMVFLMSADTKKSIPYILVIGTIIFISHWFDVFMMVMPGTLFEEWNFGMLEIGMFLLFLGVFVFTVLKALGKAPLVQKNHPYLEDSKHHHT